MIAAWMLYCLGIGLAFVVLGHALERGLHLAGRPTRWAWAAALAGTFLVPAAAWLVPDAFRAMPVPAPTPVVVGPATDMAPTLDGDPGVASSATVASRAFAPSDLDRSLAWTWVVASLAVLAALTLAAARLAVLRRRWRAVVVHGRRVLVSEDVGPAVAGVWDPRIVIPRWALNLSERQRELMLAHEEEHVRAGDPRLLASATLALLLAPWNPALWWQVRRLRLAVEMDCDARVLAAGGQAPEYGDLLLKVGGRRGRLAFAAALGEPQSFLERRIRRMTTVLPRWRWVGAMAAIVVAGGALAAACETPRPVEPPSEVSSRVADPERSVLDSAMAGRIRMVNERVRAAIDSAWARRVRPLIVESLGRHYPDLLGAVSGPPVDIWFGQDGQHVTHVARTRRTGADISSDQIRSIFPGFRPGNDGWGVVPHRVLEGVVRENVRVIWIHMSAGAGDAPSQTDPYASSRHAGVLIRQHFPELLRGRDEPVYVWLVFDAAGRVVTKGTAPRSLGARGMSTAQGPQLIPGYDTLLNRHIAEYGILGYGTLAPNSPPAMWARLRESSVQQQEPAGDHVLPESAVDERPQLVSGPALPYPDLLRHAGIQGRVIVQAVVDTTGQAEPGSLRVLQTPHAGFNQSAKSYVLRASFRPARVNGRAVRVLINVPVEFRLSG